MLTGASIAVFSYLGFDVMTTLSEEVKEPRKTLPIATVAVCLSMGTLFTIFTFASQAVSSGVNFSSPELAFLDVAKAAGGATLANVITIAMLAGGLAFAMDMLAAVGRLIFGMGRDGVLPKKIFGYVNPKTGVPVWNVIIISLLIFILTNITLDTIIPPAADEAQKNVVEIRGQFTSLEKIIIVGRNEIEGSLSFNDLLSAGNEQLESEDCDCDDVVTILYTSGTTGQPKGTMLTHANFYHNAELNACYTLHVNDQDKFFTGTPFCHIFFVLTVLGPMFKGAAVVTAPRFFPDKALELISKFKVTHFAGVPTMWIYLLQTYNSDPGKYDLGCLRFAQSAGAAMPAEFIPQIKKTFNDGFCEC